MRYVVLVVFLLNLISPIPAFAAVLIGSYGSASTMGPAASPANLNSVRYNPAAGFIILDRKSGEAVRFGYLSEVGMELQLGAADNFEQDLNSLMDELNQFEDDVAAGSYTSAEADAKAQDIQNSFNQVLSSFGDEAKLKTELTVSAPLFPIVFSVAPLPGVVSLEASVSAVSDVTFLDDTLLYDAVAKELSTDSRVYVKGGSLLHAAVGYSQPVFGIERLLPIPGELIIGAKFNIYSSSLASVESQVDRDDDKDTGDIVSDGLKSSRDTLAYGADVGAIWISDRYQLEITAKNINSPVFKYSLSESQLASDEISNGSITIKPQYTIGAAIFTKGRRLMLSGSYDLNSASDLVGDDIKRLNIAGAYFPEYLFLPSLRFGYEKNLAGEGLSSINTGVGFFKGMLNLDLTYGLETATFDDQSLPRRLGVHIGFEETF